MPLVCFLCLGPYKCSQAEPTDSHSPDRKLLVFRGTCPETTKGLLLEVVLVDRKTFSRKAYRHCCLLLKGPNMRLHLQVVMFRRPVETQAVVALHNACTMCGCTFTQDRIRLWQGTIAVLHLR
jgi:hypothetical protein